MADTSTGDPEELSESDGGSKSSEEGQKGEQGPADATEDERVQFEFFDPKGDDAQGLKAMLESLIDDRDWENDELARAIANQTRVGIVVKAGGGEEPVAITTVLPLSQHKRSGWLNSLHSFLAKSAPTGEYKRRVEEDVSQKSEARTGILISERPTNAPDELAPPLMRGILDEVEWAQEDEPTEELRKAFTIDKLVCLTWCYELASAKGEARGAEYAKAEDKELHERSEWSFAFGARGSKLMGAWPGLRLFRLAYCVRLDQARAAQRTLERRFGAPE